MDTTKNYVRMCETEEIQKKKPATFFSTTLYGVNVLEHGLNGDCWFNRNGEKIIWLPRQDQLQDMIVEVVDYETTAILESKFHKFLVWLDEWDFSSMEQLWLAFVMKEKYNKIWNGKEWIEND